MTISGPIVKYAQRLNIAEHKDILQKAEDLCQQISAESKFSVLKLSGSCQTVISLHLASKVCRRPIQDLKLILKSAGLSKVKYQNVLRNVESALNLEEVLSIDDICVQLGCSQIRQKAANSLKQYQATFLSKLSASRRDDVNFDKAIYPCAAILAAVKAEKGIRVDKNKLSDLGSTTKTELEKMAADIWAAQPQTPLNTPVKKKTVKSLVQAVLTRALENEEIVPDTPGKKQKRFNDDDEESDDDHCIFNRDDYEMWKQKILNLAGLV
ncbi:hypothetical protein TCAL_01047 [Tigriopus californicus]|uniref:Origin recognition complex subunit 6 n=1 Tax=Tigriopus californicus TaxID=6832 RepID=A0A553P468_TIGCA|nr:uncharacterized protein LOC131883800 [Tigriopus californicus]TRY72484.1 hypothetical protein TCAL_01047 [Tigriopus californicus]|eukprot:TCALIF_01047-PA protein Name:"Similar to ORC6 Origin recognition complex subunit 6 (Bos taurus)" AED:0.02 eAED:0.02 QI:0/-1/0/1/-1/1/1/0/267